MSDRCPMQSPCRLGERCAELPSVVGLVFVHWYEIGRIPVISEKYTISPHPPYLQVFLGRSVRVYDVPSLLPPDDCFVLLSQLLCCAVLCCSAVIIQNY